MVQSHLNDYLNPLKGVDISLRSSLAFPFVDGSGEWHRRTLLGGVITALGILVIPFVLLFGYYLTTFHQQATNNKSAPPEITRENARDYLSVGGEGIGVSFLLLCGWGVLFVCGMLIINTITPPIAEINTASAEIRAGVMVIGLVISSTLTLTLYILPAVLLYNTMSESRFDVFNKSPITDIAYSYDYFICYSVALLTLNLGLIILLPLSLIPYFGAVITPFFGFLLTLIPLHILSQGVSVEHISPQ